MFRSRHGSAHDGRARDAVTLGPMALVVAGSLQHWPEADLQAVAAYLKALPRAAAPVPDQDDAADPVTLQAGAKLFEDHCVDCHRDTPPDRRTIVMSPPNNLVRTQDLEPWFEENSNLYIFTRESFAKTQARIGAQPMMYEGPFFESIDIDTPADWDFAVAAARYLQESQTGAAQ